MEGKVLEVLESIEKYGVRYNGTIDVKAIIDLIKGQQAEIERLTKLAELRKKDNDDTCKLLFEAEKQVDELKKSLVVHIHIDEKLRKEYEYELKQAVKDTAREIADWLDNEKGYCGLGYLVKKQFGVEVE